MQLYVSGWREIDVLKASLRLTVMTTDGEAQKAAIKLLARVLRCEELQEQKKTADHHKNDDQR